MSPLLSPPIRTRLVFDDDTRSVQARSLTSRQPTALTLDRDAEAKSTMYPRLASSPPTIPVGATASAALGKRKAAAPQPKTAKRSEYSAGRGQQHVGITTPASAQRRRSPRIVRGSYSGSQNDHIGSTPSRADRDSRGKTPRRSQQKTRSPAIAFPFGQANNGVDIEQDASTSRVTFNIRKMRKPQHWVFIKLVCKDEFINMDKDKLRSEHARCAFCTKCNVEIKFEKSSTAYVTKHMEKFHCKELKAAVEAIAARKKSESQVLVHNEIKDLSDRTTVQQPATAEEQARADALATVWIAKSMRPFNIMNDKYFRKYARFLNSVQGHLKTIKPWKARANVEIVAAELREKLKEEIAVDCDYYTASADIWTSRSKHAFISFTLHYLSTNFDLKNWVLEIRLLPGKHDGRRIASCLEKIMIWWGLPKEKCVLFLRDGASNGRKACDLLDMKSMDCLAHLLHLIVGAGITKKKADKSAKAMMSAAKTDKDFDAALEQKACEAVDAFIAESCETSRADLDKLRSTIDKFRKLANFFSHSIKALDCLRDLQGKSKSLLPQTDCATRWNSTYAMLLRMIEIRSSLDAFFEYAAQTGEFSYSTAEQPTAEHWLTIRCLVILLKPFADATDGLGGQKYPTLVIAVPVLRSVQRKLNNANMFDPIIRSVGDEDYKYRVATLMHSVRKTYIKLFADKLKSKLPEELLWISALDPRSAEFRYLSQDEASLARTHLKIAALQMAKEMSENKDHDVRHGRVSNRSTPQSSAIKENLAWLTDVFSGGLDECETEELTMADEKLKEKCESELTLYFSDAHGTPVTTNPLEWWTKDRRNKYPILASLARKWLGCIATSVPSERAFSKSGNVVTTKRCSLDPETVRDIMFVSENYEEKDDYLSSEESENSDEDDDQFHSSYCQ